MNELEALRSIGFFAFLFIIFSLVQHVLMVILYKGLFQKLKGVHYFGNLFNKPTVVLHELVGHLIPAVLSGSNIVSIDLQEEKGQVAVKYEKNIFGGVSVFIAAFGPTILLPLLFILLFALLNGYDAVQFILLPDAISKIEIMLKNICSLSTPVAVLLWYAAVVIAPGAASSSGDIWSAKEFMRDSPLIVVFGAAIAVFVMLASYVNGFPLSEFGKMIVINAFGAFMAMYVLSWLTLYMIVNGHKLRAHLWAAAAFIIGLGFAKFGLAVPLLASLAGAYPIVSLIFAYPLIAALVAANAALFLIGLKRK